MKLRYARVRVFRLRFSVLALTILSAVALSSAPDARAQSCPDNMIVGGCGDAGNISNAPSLKFEGGPWLIGMPCPTGCYNLVAATLQASGYGNPWSAGCVSDVLANDVYEIGNLPPGPAISFFAELHVTGSQSDNAGFNATLQELGPSGAKADGSSATDGTQYVVKIPIAHAPGEPFTIAMRLSAGGFYPAGESHATAQLHFSGLPAGAWIQSCQNYDVPVPASAASWGGLKAIYR